MLSLLSMVAGLLTLFPQPAQAHTGAPASASFQALQPVVEGKLFGDPDLVFERFAAPDNRIGVDLHAYLDGVVSPAGTCPEAINFETRAVDESDGTELAPWALNLQWGSGSGQCTSWEGIDDALHYQAGGWAASPGWTDPVIEWRAIGNTTGTVFARASSEPGAFPPAAPEGLHVVSTSPGGKVLTYDQVAALALRAGWTGEDAVTAVAVARAESSFRTKAISYIGCCFGLWQINASVHGTTQSAMNDPEANAAKAFEIWGADGWQPWEAYTGPDGSGADGPWTEFEDAARAAVDRQEANGGAAFGTIASAPVTEDSTVTLAWTESNGASSYEIQRSPDGVGDWSTIGTSGDTIFVDGNATADTSYWYRVRASNANGDSGWSNIVTVIAGSTDTPPDAGCETQCGDGAFDPDAGDPDEDGEGGVSCGFNVFCWIKAALKWAFVPGPDTWAAWQDFYDDLRNRPPFNVIIGGAGFAVEFVSSVHEVFGFGAVTDDGWCIDIPGPSTTPGTVGDVPACMGGFFGDLAASSPVWMGWLRWLMGAVITFVVVLKIWRILAAAFGHSEDSDGEGATEGDDDTPEREKD